MKYPDRRDSVIALTAHALSEDEEIQRSRCDDFDIKPVELKRLLSKIGAFLDT
ncbi:MAG: hypothetical protein R3F31_05250 [Verrucomicrobiales bacterium]